MRAFDDPVDLVVAVESDGAIYAGSMDGNLYAIKDTVTTAAVPPTFDMGEAAVGVGVRKTLAIRNTDKFSRRLVSQECL